MDRFFFVPLKYIRPLIHPIKKNIGWFAIRGIQLHLIHPSPQDSILGKKVASLEASLGSVDWKLDVFFQERPCRRPWHICCFWYCWYYGCFQKRGKTPKMDGENKGNWKSLWTNEIRFGGYPSHYFWFNTHISPSFFHVVSLCVTRFGSSGPYWDP